MNRNIADALERIERANDQALSKQPRFLGITEKAKFFSSLYAWTKSALADEPDYSPDNRARDRWLSNAWRTEPHLAGVVNSVTSIDKNRGWTITGGRNMVNRYNVTLRGAENGKGWRHFMSKAAMSFYTADMGTVVEVGRDGQLGPMRALYNVDPARCKLTGKLDLPLAYKPAKGNEQEWPADGFFRVVSLPNTNEDYNDLGFCAFSRAVQLTKLMVAVYEHDTEQLGARAPRGLLLLSNIDQEQWDGAMKSRKAQLDNKGQNYFGGVAVLAQEGVDQVDAKLIALSQLPANFNLREFTDLLIYGYALCFGYDPNEFWPVASGALGRGRESELQHQKATGKGGLDFILNLQDQLQLELPDTLFFEFDQRDISGELEEAVVQKAWADLAAVLYGSGAGVLSQDEVRIMLAQQGVIPQDWTVNEEDAVATAEGEQRSHDPDEQRRRYAMLDQCWLSAFDSPHEPIVRMNDKRQEKILWPSGMDFLKEHQTNPIARSMAAQYGARNVTVAHDLWGRSFAIPQLTTVQRAEDEVLFEDDDFTITADDVAKAIQSRKERVGKQFGQLLTAKEE